MPSEIYLVKVGMTMTEGAVEEWYVGDGESVDAGSLLYRLETEKVNLDVDAETAGTVKHLAQPGVMLEPGDVIGFIFAPDEEIPDVLPTPRAQAPEATPSVAQAAAPEAAAPEAAAPEAAPATSTAGDRRPSSPAARKLAQEIGIDLGAVAGTGPRGRITREDVERAAATPSPAAPGAGAGRRPASPAARKLAEELGLDLAAIGGTGPRGRITREDVEQAAAARTAAPAPAAALSAASAPQPLRGMRRTIAERMHASLANSAQLTLDMEAEMDDAVKLRTQLAAEWEADGVRPGYTDLVMLAAAKALPQHPRMNSALIDDAIVPSEAVHVGMAVALDEGLVVPVIHAAATKDLKTIAQESSALAARARAGALTLEDVQGGTFTVTSLGMYGVDGFTPILNAPQTGILGVGRIYEAVGWEGDTPVRRRRMRLSLTWDHRVIDGAPAAQFLATVREYLEAPYRLLV